LLQYFLTFSIYFNSWRLMFPISVNNDDYPLEIRLIRDAVFVFFICIFIIYVMKNNIKIPQNHMSRLLFALIIFTFFSSLPSLFVMNPAEYIQHYLRNILSYSIFIFIPIYIISLEKIESITEF